MRSRSVLLSAVPALTLLLSACGSGPMPPPSATESAQTSGGLKGIYFNAQKPQEVLSFTDQTKGSDFSWKLNSDTNGVIGQWTGTLTPSESGKYAFSVEGLTYSDVLINGKEIPASGISLIQGTPYWIQITGRQLSANGSATLMWGKDGGVATPLSAGLLSSNTTVQSRSLQALDIPLNQVINPNSGFESGVANWNIYSTQTGSITVTQPGLNSANELKITSHDVNDSAYWYTYDGNAVVPLATYRLEVSIRTDGAARCRVSESGDSVSADIDKTFNGATGYQTFSTTFILPSADRSLYFSVRNASKWNGLSGNCYFDDVKLTRIADAPVIPDPATNILVNGEANPDPNDPSYAQGWTYINKNYISGLVRPGYNGSPTGFQIADVNYSGMPSQTIPASALQPNTEYVLKAWMKGTVNCWVRVNKAVINSPSDVLAQIHPRFTDAWSEGAVTFTTGATVSDLQVVMGSSSTCIADNVRFGPRIASTSNPLVSVTPLGAPPAPIPAPYSTVNTYRVTAPQAAFAQANMEVVIPISNPENPDQVITELYKYENGVYVKEQIGGEGDKFRLFINPETNPDGSLPNSFEGTYVVTKASVSDLKASFSATGGFFNGIYGECPEGTISSFGKCVNAPTQLSGQAINLLNPGKNFISLNAGNTSSYCFTAFDPVGIHPSNYNAKLCSFATEERVRNEIVNTRKPDLVTIQELWNGDCSTVSPDINLDRVCGPRLGILRLTGGEVQQVKRLFPSSIYDTACAPLDAGGYECTAIRKSVFKFDTPSSEVASGVKSQIAATTDYCVDDTKQKGKDTGFFGTTISLVNPIGPRPTSFDVWNAHLATPFGFPRGNRNCRAQQITALRKAYLNSRRKVLIAGDFNTEFAEMVNNAYPIDVAALRSLSTAFDTKVDYFPAVKLSYMISNQTEITAFSGTVTLPLFGAVGLKYGFDHVMSNFSDVVPGASCRRIAVKKLDHRSTQCALQGFDTGTVRTGLLVTDTSGQYPTEYVTTLINAYRKGAKLSWISWTGTTVHDVYIPDNVETQVEVNMNCMYATPASQIFSVQANESTGTTLRQAVFRPYCP